MALSHTLATGQTYTTRNHYRQQQTHFRQRKLCRKFFPTHKHLRRRDAPDEENLDATDRRRRKIDKSRAETKTHTRASAKPFPLLCALQTKKGCLSMTIWDVAFTQLLVTFFPVKSFENSSESLFRADTDSGFRFFLALNATEHNKCQLASTS